MESDTHIANEIISDIIQAAFDALNPLDDKIDPTIGEATSKCHNEAMEIVSEIIQSAYDVASIVTSDEVEVSSIIERILQLAFNDCDNDTLSVEPIDSIESNKMIDENEFEVQPMSDVESDTSLIVECIDCFDDEMSAELHHDCRLHDQCKASIVVEDIEICKNDELSSEGIPEPLLEGQKTEFDRTEPIDNGIVVETIAASSNLTECEPPANDVIYDDETLRLNGYVTTYIGDVKCVTNFVLQSDPRYTSKCRCSGLPNGFTENKLIPKLEKCGRVVELRFAADAEGVVDVTFMTEIERDNAVRIVNGRKVQGRTITMSRLNEKRRILVRHIPIAATKQELHDYFNKMNKNLDCVHIPGGNDWQKQSRDFCYVQYKDHESAAKAKKFISNATMWGRKLKCCWAHCQPHHTPNTWQISRTLYMDNLHPGMTTSDLRKLFSVYGTLAEVDKSGNWAAIKFEKVDQSKRAFYEIDRTLLGNENFKLSTEKILEPARSKSCDQSEPIVVTPPVKHDRMIAASTSKTEKQMFFLK